MLRACICAVALTLTLAAAASASAQTTERMAGIFAAETDAMGSAVGQSLMGGETIFVYAQGRAKIPSAAPAPTPVQAYQTMIEGKAPTAVEAARQRDAKVEAIRAAAARYGAEVKVVSEIFGIEGAARIPPVPAVSTATARGMGDYFQPAAPASPAKPSADGARPFAVRTTLRITPAPHSDVPALLDAVHAAGSDDVHAEAPFQNIVTSRAMDLMGFGTTEKVDDAVWQAASTEAFRSAREQARTLAAAAGRELGAARQITYLARTVDGDNASITVAVRFALVPLH